MPSTPELCPPAPPDRGHASASEELASCDTDRLAGMFKALGDPARLRMVAMIASVPELCVCEITPAFELSSATVSHHLKALREAGLIDGERRGTFVYYRIRPEALEALSRILDVARPPAA